MGGVLLILNKNQRAILVKLSFDTFYIPAHMVRNWNRIIQHLFDLWQLNLSNIFSFGHYLRFFIPAHLKWTHA